MNQWSSTCPCPEGHKQLESRLLSSRLRAMATGVLIGQRALSLNDATVQFAVAARSSSKSADDVARQIIHDRGIHPWAPTVVAQPPTTR